MRVATRKASLDREPPLRAHLEAARIGYRHHGTYVGDGKVARYDGLCRRRKSGRISEVTLSAFALGRAVRIVDHPGCACAREEIVARARSRIGENRYRLVTNNCEHFCNWCVNRRSHSAQTERPVALALRALTRVAGCITSVAATIESELGQADLNVRTS
jgi:hypothetical protein